MMIKLRIAVATLLLMSHATLSAQDHQSRSQRQEYCLVRLIDKVFTKKLWVRIDYGEGETFLMDSTGNRREFNSQVDVLNYLEKKGWTLVTIDKQENYSNLIFRQKWLVSETSVQEK